MPQKLKKSKKTTAFCCLESNSRFEYNLSLLLFLLLSGLFWMPGSV
jgi:hypothetical protein